MIVVGGTYWETCASPEWARMQGSGFRAAMALSELCPGLHLHTYAPIEWIDDLKASLDPRGVVSTVARIGQTFEFDYWYALLKEYASRPLPKPDRHPPLVVDGSVVLAFGMLEGTARITAKRVVYDPRTAHPDASFRTARVEVGQLAYVIQQEDLLDIARLPEPRDLRDAAASLMRNERADVVVARHPFGGATVYVGERPGVEVPCHAADAWFRIGEGDVFTAAFAYWWGEKHLPPVEAATLASRSVAFYNDGPDRFLPAGDDLSSLTPVSRPEGSWTVFLSGPNLTLSQRWLFEEARRVLGDLGAQVEIAFPKGVQAATNQCGWGLGQPGVPASLLALGDARDPLTNVHVGFAKASGLPVVLLAEATPDWDPAVFDGTGCEIVKDLATAIYKSCIACWRTAARSEPSA
ncbi:hypothetical protein ASG51_14525 [Methylobacterium sp. Leaf465]|uniref:hypothetical protein n=1 Tax=Methylobacterium sp. Leaf465 TaxID=1736385 RepID=UPI0006FD868A|nr:hypothetical protein [Methylobacterium sp. Leaf465]KQT70258.1 hypothetical protein ASG51_14525 [Methylobacterium sp. Leaf465]